ncbi:plant basic secretory protein [Patellaria atrata CBS 101060]|uniref:Plant basic secretory protein n=1 Tax=Patellaria atrata CBS 101060 TaxID=1346257 RepID=A0A9P4VL86_9PEZI|nr:plant basic secretory protein [Patellaria atrata CBS 101060]
MPPATPLYFQQGISPASASGTPKKRHPKFPKPLLRLELRDLSHAGSRVFLSKIDVSTVLEEAVGGVLHLLYSPHSVIPPTRSVTLVLRSMSGVAYTTGKDIDQDHKEIHFSTDYVAQISKERQRSEMLGVIRHEMVHCWQWNGVSTAPGGLIEGIADWVRLKSDMVPPHWRKEADGDWDAGYQHTGYFLEYLEQRFGEGSVMAVNERLRDRKYEEEEFWTYLFGDSVTNLWKDYGQHLRKDVGDASVEDNKTYKDVVIGRGKDAE